MCGFGFGIMKHLPREDGGGATAAPSQPPCHSTRSPEAKRRVIPLRAQSTENWPHMAETWPFSRSPQKLSGHDHPLDLVGALVDLGDRGPAGSLRSYMACQAAGCQHGFSTVTGVAAKAAVNTMMR